MKRALLLASLLLAGCAEEFEDDLIDVPTEPRDPRFITVTLDQRPALFAVLEGPAKDWRVLAGDRSYYFLEVPTYSVMVVCLDGERARTMVITRSYTTKLELRCGADPLVVGGRVAQPGMVTLGAHAAASPLPDWSFQLPARSGYSDLIASSNERVLVQRGLQIAGSTTLPAIELAGATPLVPHPFPVTVDNLAADETLIATTTWVTQRIPQGAMIYRGALPPKVAPRTLQWAKEDQFLELSTERVEGARRTTHGVRSLLIEAPSPLTLWRPFPGLRFETRAAGEVIARWDEGPSGDYGIGGVVETELVDAAGRSFFSSDGQSYHEHGELALAPPDVPGYLPEWRVDVTGAHRRTLRAERLAWHRFTFSMSETIPPPASSPTIGNPSR